MDHPATRDCLVEECPECGMRDCPAEEPRHYDQGGCPVCSPTPPLTQPSPRLIRLADLQQPPSECRAARESGTCMYVLDDIQQYVPDVHSVGYLVDLTKWVVCVSSSSSITKTNTKKTTEDSTDSDSDSSHIQAEEQSGHPPPTCTLSELAMQWAHDMPPEDRATTHVLLMDGHPHALCRRLTTSPYPCSASGRPQEQADAQAQAHARAQAADNPLLSVRYVRAVQRELTRDRFAVLARYQDLVHAVMADTRQWMFTASGGGEFHRVYLLTGVGDERVPTESTANAWRLQKLLRQKGYESSQCTATGMLIVSSASPSSWAWLNHTHIGRRYRQLRSAAAASVGASSSSARGRPRGRPRNIVTDAADVADVAAASK